MVVEFDVTVDDVVLHAYDTGGDGLPVVWHHGTPNLGTPPEPLFAPGIRWISYDRPGYGGSPRRPGRDLAAAASWAAAVADALGVDRFAVMGHSGGGSYALATAALLPQRVLAVVSGAALAPHDAVGLDWYAGMAPSGVASLRAATEGREAKERYEATSGDAYDPEFTPADLAALAGPWSWFDGVVSPALAGGPGGLVDDDIAYVNPWGVDPATVTAPVLLLHGGRDRVVPAAHGRWLADRCPNAELRFSPDDGHISVLTGAPAAVDWLRQRAT